MGLVFKLSQALLKEGAFEYLDLAAMGTIADVAELIGENRIFAKEGLKCIAATQNHGLKALLDTSGLRGKKMRTHSVGFVL